MLKRKKEILSSIAIILFVGNYQICEYYYKTDLIKWWNLRTQIYSIIFAILFQVALIESKGLSRAIISIGFSFCVSDVIDRVIFNSADFTVKDIFMIIVTIILTNINYVRERRKDIKSKIG